MQLNINLNSKKLNCTKKNLNNQIKNLRKINYFNPH
jgi:hypothetical protein